MSNNIKPVNLGVMEDFPFIEQSIDSITEYGMISKIGSKLNEIITTINSIFDNAVNEYINLRFNNIMMNTLYDSETETLILYLDNEEVDD